MPALVARHFGTNHREGLVQPALEQLFDRLVVHFDEPFADVSMFPTFMVSELARRHVTVALAGDGGDELFGGYDSYRAQAIAARLERVVPGAAVRALDRPSRCCGRASGSGGRSTSSSASSSGAANSPGEIAHYRWMTFLDERGRRRGS